MAADDEDKNVRRMTFDGWDTYFLTQWSGVMAFARPFSHKHYAR